MSVEILAGNSFPEIKCFNDRTNYRDVGLVKKTNKGYWGIKVLVRGKSLLFITLRPGRGNEKMLRYGVTE